MTPYDPNVPEKLSKRLHPNMFKYRTRANNGRSVIEAAPLSYQAKNQFLCAFLSGNLKAIEAAAFIGVSTVCPKIPFLHCSR